MLQMTGERQIATSIDKIKPDHRQRYEFAADQISDKYENAKVLDAACGVGYGSWVMAEKGIQVTGIDISADALDVAKQHYSIDDLTKFVQCDIVRDALPDAHFDIIVSFETIEHVEEDELILSKFSELGDYLFVSVPNEEVVPFSKETHPFHFRHYTPDEFEALLEKTGWKPMQWFTQYDKYPGDVYEADDGRSLIVIARSKK